MQMVNGQYSTLKMVAVAEVVVKLVNSSRSKNNNMHQWMVTRNLVFVDIHVRRNCYKFGSLSLILQNLKLTWSLGIELSTIGLLIQLKMWKLHGDMNDSIAEKAKKLHWFIQFSALRPVPSYFCSIPSFLLCISDDSASTYKGCRLSSTEWL